MQPYASTPRPTTRPRIRSVGTGRGAPLHGAAKRKPEQVPRKSPEKPRSSDLRPNAKTLVRRPCPMHEDAPTSVSMVAGVHDHRATNGLQTPMKPAGYQAVHMHCIGSHPAQLCPIQDQVPRTSSTRPSKTGKPNSATNRSILAGLVHEYGLEAARIGAEPGECLTRSTMSNLVTASVLGAWMLDTRLSADPLMLPTGQTRGSAPTRAPPPDQSTIVL